MAAPAKFLFDTDFSAPDRSRERPTPVEMAQKIAAAEARAYRDGYDAGQREAKADRSSIVEDVDCIPLYTDGLCEPIDDLGQVLEAVEELFAVRGVGKTKARKVRRHQMVAVSQGWNEIAKHVRRRRETMEQQDRRMILRTCFAIEDPAAVDQDLLISGHR